MGVAVLLKRNDNEKKFTFKRCSFKYFLISHSKWRDTTV